MGTVRSACPGVRVCIRCIEGGPGLQQEAACHRGRSAARTLAARMSMPRSSLFSLTLPCISLSPACTADSALASKSIAAESYNSMWSTADSVDSCITSCRGNVLLPVIYTARRDAILGAMGLDMRLQARVRDYVCLAGGGGERARRKRGRKHPWHHQHSVLLNRVGTCNQDLAPQAWPHLPHGGQLRQVGREVCAGHLQFPQHFRRLRCR